MAERVGFVAACNEPQASCVHLRAPRYGGQPSRGLPTVARASVGKRERRLAERVGFEPQPVVANKELKEFQLPHDPLDPHECLGRDTY